MDNFQNRLSQLIRQNNIEQKDISKGTGITEATISRYVNGKMKPTMKNAKLLADYFGVSINFLSGNDQDQYYINEDTAELAQEIFDNPELKILMKASKKLKKSDLESLIKIINSMKPGDYEND